MSAPLSNEVALQLVASLRANADQTALQTRVLRATLPQYLDLRALTARYALDPKQVRALLDHHRISVAPHGNGLRVHIDDILRLDSLLKRERTPQGIPA